MRSSCVEVPKRGEDSKEEGRSDMMCPTEGGMVLILMFRLMLYVGYRGASYWRRDVIIEMMENRRINFV